MSNGILTPSGFSPLVLQRIDACPCEVKKIDRWIFDSTKALWRDCPEELINQVVLLSSLFCGHTISKCQVASKIHIALNLLKVAELNGNRFQETLKQLLDSFHSECGVTHWAGICAVFLRLHEYDEESIFETLVSHTESYESAHDGDPRWEEELLADIWLGIDQSLEIFSPSLISQNDLLSSQVVNNEEIFSSSNQKDRHDQGASYDTESNKGGAL